MTIHETQSLDVPQMVALAAAKRAEYRSYQPLFWRQADDAEVLQQPFFEKLMAQENVIALVAKREGALLGFIIATLVEAPPVYNPGGLTCLIDDFTVAVPHLWASLGRELFEEATQRAKKSGAVQVVTVCGHEDEAKRGFLAEMGSSIASEWWTQAL